MHITLPTTFAPFFCPDMLPYSAFIFLAHCRCRQDCAEPRIAFASAQAQKFIQCRKSFPRDELSWVHFYSSQLRSRTRVVCGVWYYFLQLLTGSLSLMRNQHTRVRPIVHPRLLSLKDRLILVGNFPGYCLQYSIALMMHHYSLHGASSGEWSIYEASLSVNIVNLFKCGMP